MDNIGQEKPKKGPMLNVNEKLYRQSLNKKFGTHIEKPMVFKTFKNKQSILRNKVISGKHPWGLKS